MRVQHSSGFTLVELVVVLAILFVLGMILYPVFTHDRHENQPQSSCMSHQRQLAIGLLAFAADGNEILTLPDEWVVVTNMSTDPKLFDCKSNRHNGTPMNPDYGMNAFLYNIDPKTGKKTGVTLSEIDDPSTIELILDIRCPTGATSQKLNGRQTNPFPDSYTVTGYFGTGANADWRHEKSIVVSYADGHVGAILPDKLSEVGRTRYNIPIGEKPAEGRTR